MDLRTAALAVTMLLLSACASAPLPPTVVVKDISVLAGTYTGTVQETNEMDRSARLVLEPDGIFELAASDPKGFRTLGQVVRQPDGMLRYGYKELRASSDFVYKGTGSVHEGDGRRVLVFVSHDGNVTVTVERSLK